MKRTFVIGDIHGGLKALRQVMARASVSPDDALIFLGDYVDGWSESAYVVEFLINLSGYQNCIFLKGNHDEWCEEWLRTGTADSSWLFHGGENTLQSYASIDTDTRQKHLHFFEQMKFYEIDAQNRLFIHAGFTSLKGPQQEPDIANCCWDRTLWELAITRNKKTAINKRRLPKKLRLFHEIYIGHTPTLYYFIETPMQACNVWNIDTGAAFTGKLTMMDIDTKKFWQSDPLKDLYPGESGRNSVD